MPLFMLFTAFSNLFGVGGASLISRCLGAGEREKARRCAAFCISLMGTVSNTALNHIISTYSNEAVAGMVIAKKLNLLAFAVAQGITQGTLPLIGYCFTSSDRNRMARVIRTLAVICAGFALASAALLFSAPHPSPASSSTTVKRRPAAGSFCASSALPGSPPCSSFSA